MRRVRAAFEDFGNMIFFAGETLAWMFRPPFRPELILAQMAAIGVGSTFIVAITGTFAGMVLALQFQYAMGQLGAEGYVGGSVAVALTRELSPVFTALMIVARSGSAITTELGTMRVTEQIDAMESMAVSPVQYLVAPRLVASLAMFPVLTMLFNALGFAGAYVMGIYVSRISPGPFIEHTRELVIPADIMHGLTKAVIFGAAVAIISCWRGYAASGGARGVGTGTTRSVVMSSISILVVDYAFTVISVTGGGE
jgi:phospholipid/cholesterol/gamma-HCH transport system permease protein